MEELPVQTRTRNEIVDLTAEVQAVVERSGVVEGMAYLYCPHTTAGVTINENADPAVKRDFLAYLERLVPEQGDYRHAEGNSDAHIKAILVGACQPVPVSGGRLTLGTWQGLFFCEFDGPRRRRVLIRVMREG